MHTIIIFYLWRMNLFATPLEAKFHGPVFINNNTFSHLSPTSSHPSATTSKELRHQFAACSA